MNDLAIAQLDHFLEALDRATTVNTLYLALNIHFPPCLSGAFLGESIEVFQRISDLTGTMTVTAVFPDGMRVSAHQGNHLNEFQGDPKTLHQRCVSALKDRLAEYVTDLMTP